MFTGLYVICVDMSSMLEKDLTLDFICTIRIQLVHLAIEWSLFLT